MAIVVFFRAAFRLKWDCGPLIVPQFSISSPFGAAVAVVVVVGTDAAVAVWQPTRLVPHLKWRTFL